MPLEAKIPLFKQLRKLSPYCILSGLNWNNDNPEAKSPDLIYSVVKSYGFLFKDVLGSPITEGEKKTTILRFLLAEAIKIIKGARPDRIDYHTPIKERQKIGNKTDFNTDHTTTIHSFADGQPVSFVIMFCS